VTVFDGAADRQVDGFAHLDVGDDAAGVTLGQRMGPGTVGLSSLIKVDEMRKKV
jgi:hypothetical protein